MTPLHDKILVSVNIEQKETMLVGGIEFKMANLFETNYREKNPVLCKVEVGNDIVQPGMVLVVHHNMFSINFIQDNLFSIPFKKTIFGILNADGSIIPICGNLLCERVNIPSILEMPPELQEQYIDRVKVTDGGQTRYNPGDLLFTRPYSYYEIVYTVNGEQKRVHKCDSDMVCAVIRSPK